MNNVAYERFVLLASLAAREQDLQKYQDLVDELNAILLKVLRENGAALNS